MAKIRVPPVPKPEPKPKLSCPDPMYDYPKAPFTFDPSEFSTQQMTNANPMPPRKNSYYLFTAKWMRKRPCCQVLKAEVTVAFRALSPGTNPTTSPDAGNDSFVFVKNEGQVIKSAPVYNAGSPFQAGHTITKTFDLSSASELSWLNASGKLSFLVQDDTQVVDVKIRLTVCCLSSIEK